MCAFSAAANGPAVPHNCFDGGAAWRDTIYDNKDFMANIWRPLHPIFSYDGWFSKFTYRLDLLHMLDHNGVTGSVIGNIFQMRINDFVNILPGATIGECIDFLSDDIRAYYTATGEINQVGRLTSANICASGEFPEFHGAGVKAANTRGLVKYTWNLQQRAT
eukprot:6900702-Pyramimonas_sp.AAC.1